jgi:hypothetical protein
MYTPWLIVVRDGEREKRSDHRHADAKTSANDDQ